MLRVSINSTVDGIAHRVDVRDLLEELEREDRVMERGELVRFLP